MCIMHVHVHVRRCFHDGMGVITMAAKKADVQSIYSLGPGGLGLAKFRE